MTRKRLNTINAKLGALNNLEYILENMKKEFKKEDRNFDLAFKVEKYGGDESICHAAYIDYEYLAPALTMYCNKLKADLKGLGLED